ncbi:hypothetical protein JKI95_07500 [Corynebacterium aquatimens]|uniref:hypothetical protein n=1 Tax=Corynebacterium TaxID=1716 RepID=UPI001F251BEE|nr:MULTISPECIES: hypothetical protein [Corynebacterium]QYH19105.1 hypothetical protein JKI95_07500 [Corynebacterium aquatimens]UIZ92037.1 hypothetical protein JZY91_10265 [Corynebacterium sp. CNCTC7651]
MNNQSTREAKRTQEIELIKRVAGEAKKSIVTGPAAARLLTLSTYSWVTQVDLILNNRGHTWGKKRTYTDRRYHGASIDAYQISSTAGISHTCLLRCLFDSFRYHGRLEALVQIESARWKWSNLTVDELLKHTDVLPRAKGLREFRSLIEFSGATSQSPLETLARETILTAIEKGELPEVHTVEFQIPFWIKTRDGTMQIARVDVLINGYLVLELDGLIKSDGTFGDPDTITREERHREMELQNQGLLVRRAGWTNGRGEALLNLIRTTLANNPAPAVLPVRAEPSAA